MRSRRIVAVACVVVSVISVTLPAGRARAQSRAVTVQATACEDLDLTEIERLLAIDLAEVSAQLKEGTPTVHLTCSAGSVKIAVPDPITDKRLERDIPAPPQNARERTIALAVSELFLTSWLELLLSERTRREASVRVVSTPAAAGAAERMARGSVHVITGTRWEIALASAARFHDRSAPLTLWETSLRPTIFLSGGLHLSIEAGYARGNAARPNGVVDASLARLGLGAGLRSPRFGVLSFDVGASASTVYARLEGRPSNDGVSGASAAGVGGEVSIGGGPLLSLGIFRIGADARAIATFPTLSGRVSNVDPVKLGGAWFVVSASLGLAWGE